MSSKERIEYRKVLEEQYSLLTGGGESTFVISQDSTDSSAPLIIQIVTDEATKDSYTSEEKSDFLANLQKAIQENRILSQTSAASAEGSFTGQSSEQYVPEPEPLPEPEPEPEPIYNATFTNTFTNVIEELDYTDKEDLENSIKDSILRLYPSVSLNDIVVEINQDTIAGELSYSVIVDSAPEELASDFAAIADTSNNTLSEINTDIQNDSNINVDVTQSNPPQSSVEEKVADPPKSPTYTFGYSVKIHGIGSYSNLEIEDEVKIIKLIRNSINNNHANPDNISIILNNSSSSGLILIFRVYRIRKKM
jgi:hypothetical protein